jgi:CxxC-x17-CxxC domain-containing protein
MIFDKFKSNGPREWVKGNWKCSGCGAEITELPFEPTGDRPVHCKDCWKKNRPQRDFAPRQSVQGNWKCSDCGTAITELPFEPSGDRPIYCKDCWKKNKPPRY